MARFTNYATLSYNGGTTDSNVVTGELIEILTANKNAVDKSYTANDRITYVLSLVNSGTSMLSGLTVTDDLGGYTFNTGTVYPLAYVDGSMQYYINGVLQPSLTVTEAAGLTVSGISVPANGNAQLIYDAAVTGYAPLGADAVITNQATVSGDSLSEAITASTDIGMEARVNLSISKALCPTSVTENGQLTYTFVIENIGSVAATEQDSVVLSDTFSPRLKDITVTLNDTVWTEGTNYTYNAATGEFSTIAGQLTVSQAEYAQGSDGIWGVAPGSATLTVSGTI